MEKEYTMEKIVIFGASGGAIKVAHTLQNLGIDFEYFVDNDINKWGVEIEGRPVKNPEVLKNTDERILIASDYQSEIEDQLESWGILERLILKEECIFQYFNSNKEVYEQYYNQSIQQRKSASRNIIIELADAGICLGGIETWALMVTRNFIKRGYPTELWIRKQEQVVPEDIQRNTIEIDYNYSRYKESIEDTVKMLIDKLPCTVISNWQSQVMVAAILVKRMYPQQMKIISVIHNDKKVLYRRQKYMERNTDVIFGVSRKICNTFRDDYSIPISKVVYKESPVGYTDYEKIYTLNPKEPVRIGYAARITKYQKRADLLAQLINKINERNLNVDIEIAGDGNYFDRFKMSVDLSRGNVKLLGNLPREKMQEFWKNKDIFINVSDFEGASISMLEAMAVGNVPVVTLVSGVDEYIENDVNGYYVPIGDIESIVEKIEHLIGDREKLKVMGEKSRKIVKEKCNEEDYIDVLERLI